MVLHRCPHVQYLSCVFFAFQAETEGQEAAASASEAKPSSGGGGQRRSPRCQKASSQGGDVQLTEAGGGLQLR